MESVPGHFERVKSFQESTVSPGDEKRRAGVRRPFVCPLFPLSGTG
jgi:hypothetical protein